MAAVEDFMYDEKDDEKTHLNPPSLTRRLSSQFLPETERQRSIVDNIGSTINQYVPDEITQHIPGLTPIANTQLKPTYFCHICFTKKEIDTGFTLTNCGHQFCPECINGFIQNKINNNIINLTCFYPTDQQQNSSCGAKISTHDIHQLVNANTWRKFEKFKANSENIYSRQCPFCDCTQTGTPEHPMIRCHNKQCNKQYCLYHSNAHDINQTCEQYELSMAKETKMNEMAITEIGGADNIKQCPQCQFTIIKNGGCNHMKCVKCGCSFCWLCLQIIQDEELPQHYKNPNSACNGQQFAGMEYEMPPVWVIILLTICLIILCIPAVVLAIAFGSHPFVVCCCGNQQQSVSERVFGCWVVWLVVLAFIVVFVPVCILYVIWMLLKAMYGIIRICLPCLPACCD